MNISNSNPHTIVNTFGYHYFFQKSQIVKHNSIFMYKLFLEAKARCTKVHNFNYKCDQ